MLNSGYENQPLDARGIQVPQNVQFTITPTGEVYGDDVQLGKLFVAKVKEMRDLKQEGDNLYTYPRLDEVEDLVNARTFSQGFAQMSNVNTVNEMVNLIETQRLVETYQKVMTTHMNDLNNDAITKLAAVRA